MSILDDIEELAVDGLDFLTGVTERDALHVILRLCVEARVDGPNEAEHELNSIIMERNLIMQPGVSVVH